MSRLREMNYSSCIESLVKLSLKRNSTEVDVKFALSSGTFGVQDNSDEVTQADFQIFAENLISLRDSITIEAVFTKAIEEFHKVIVRTKSFTLSVQNGMQIKKPPSCEIMPSRGLWVYLLASSEINFKTPFIEDLKIFISDLALIHYKVTFRLIDLEAKTIVALYEGTSSLAERVAQVRKIRYHDIYSDLVDDSSFKMEICYFFHELADRSSLDSIISMNGERYIDTERYISSHLTPNFPDINFVGIVQCQDPNLIKCHGVIYERLVKLLEKVDILSLKNENKDDLRLILEEDNRDKVKESVHIDLTMDSPKKQKHSNTEYLLEINESDDALYYEVACPEPEQDSFKSQEKLKDMFEKWLKCAFAFPNEDFEELEEPKPSEASTLKLSDSTIHSSKKGSALLALEASYSSMDKESKVLVRDSDISRVLKRPTFKSKLFSHEEMMNYSKSFSNPFPWRSESKNKQDDDVILLDEPATALPKFDKSFKIPKKSSVEKPQDPMSLQSLIEDISDIECDDGAGLMPLQKVSFIEEQQKELKRIEEINSSKRILNSTLKDCSTESNSSPLLLPRKPMLESISRILEKHRLSENSKTHSFSNRNGDSSKDEFLGESSKSFSLRNASVFGGEVKKFDLDKHEAAYNNSKEYNSVYNKVKDKVSSFFNSFSKDKPTDEKEKSFSEDDVSIVGVSFGNPPKNGCVRKREMEVSSTSLTEDDDVKVVEPVRQKNKIFKTRTQSSRSDTKDVDIVEVIDVDKDTDNYSRRSQNEFRERERDRRDLERWRTKDPRGRNSYRNDYRDRRDRDRDRDRHRANPLNNYYNRSRSPSDRSRRY